LDGKPGLAKAHTSRKAASSPNQVYQKNRSAARLGYACRHRTIRANGELVFDFESRKAFDVDFVNYHQ